jgi:hypothetical protein
MDLRSSTPINLKRKAILTSAPAFILVAIEFLGIALTDAHLAPLFPNNPILGVIGGIGLGLSLIAFPAAIVSVYYAAWNQPSKKLRRFLLLLSVSAILLSLFGCGWTMSGHPTWYQGYI